MAIPPLLLLLAASAPGVAGLLSPPPLLGKLGHALDIVRSGDFETLLERHASLHEGGLSRLTLPQHEEVWLATTPEVVREFTVTNGRAFQDREDRLLGEGEEDEEGEGGATKGIVASTGEERRVHRGFLNPAFFSRECVAAQLRRAIDETRAMLGDDGSAGGPEQDTEAAMAAARLITPQGAGELVTFVQDLSLRIQFRAIFDADLAPPAAPRVCDDDGNGSGEEQQRQQQQQQQPAAATHGAVRRPTSPTVERMARLSASIRVALAQFRAVSFAPRGEAGGASQRGEQRSSVMAFVRRFTNARRQRAQLSARIERHFGPRKRDAAGAAFAAMLRGLSRGRLAPRRGAAPGSGDSASSASGSDPLRFDEVERLVAMRCAVADDASAAESAESTSTTTTTTMPWRDVMADMLGSDAGLSEQDMTVLAKDLVAAGSDTTASAVTMTIFELLRASYASRMSGESSSVFDEAISEALNMDVTALVDDRSVQSQLPFTTACTKEALRLHPPAVSEIDTVHT